MRQRIFGWLLTVCLASGCVVAHDPGLSTLALTVGEEGLEAVLTLSPQDFLILSGPAGEWADQSNLATLIREIIEVRQGERSLEPVTAKAVRPDGENVELHLRYPRLSGDAWSVHPVLLERLPRGHRQYLSLRGTQGNYIRERVLDARQAVVTIDASHTDRSAGSRVDAFGQFFVLGVEHIATGYDHLLFLLVLLIAGSGLLGACKIITSFTVAHSVTLALAAVEWIDVPAHVVEPLIALSIAYVGVENLFRKNREDRWLLTFGFGLIHGLGFASVLRELGVASAGGGILLPLLSFNLGVEVGQLVVAGFALPLIWWWRQRSEFAPRYVHACSLVALLIGSYWLIERTLL